MTSENLKSAAIVVLFTLSAFFSLKFYSLKSEQGRVYRKYIPKSVKYVKNADSLNDTVVPISVPTAIYKDNITGIEHLMVAGDKNEYIEKEVDERIQKFTPLIDSIVLALS